MKVILAIDGGGSRTRCLAIDEGGQTLSAVETGASNHLLVERETVVRSLSDAIENALIQGNLQGTDVACVSAGLAGVDYDGAGEEEMKQVMSGLGFNRTVVNGDMVIAHAGALAGKQGVMALAGTGSSILGIGKNGERVKVGGWGPIFGDEGSAYRIGQMALRAAARDFDGFGAKTALTEAVKNALGIKDFRETVNLVYIQGLEIREIAALSRTAYEVAEAGDEVARKIFLGAGEELAESVATAISRLSISGEAVDISYQGSVLESCALVRESFVENLMQREPQAEILPPKYSPVIGAYLLGRASLGLQTDERIFKMLNEQREKK
jgi:N-acetylglucosamine kinase